MASEEVAFDLVEKTKFMKFVIMSQCLLQKWNILVIMEDLEPYLTIFQAQIYILQKNSSSSIKIEMTAPVTRLKQNNKNVMQFFLPKRLYS